MANEDIELAIINRVNEVVTKGRADVMSGVDAKLGDFRTEVINAINAMTQQNAQQFQQFQAAQQQVVPQAAPQVAPPAKPFQPVRAFGQGPWAPHPVALTRNQAMQMVAAGQSSPELLQIADRGITALGIEAAYNQHLVQAPIRRGLTTQEIAVLAIGGTAIAAGAVVGTMYFTKTGLFRPKDIDSDLPKIG